MSISFYILRSFCLSKIALLGVLLFSCFAYSQQTLTFNVAGNISATRTVNFCTGNKVCSGGFGALSCPSNLISLSGSSGSRILSVGSVPVPGGVNCSNSSPNISGVNVPDDFTVTSYSCNINMSGPGGSASVSCSSSGNSASVDLGNERFTAGSCSSENPCSNSCYGFTTFAVCSVTGTTNADSIQFCSATSSGANSILTQFQSECSAQGGIDSSSVVQRDGYYCLEKNCKAQYTGDCGILGVTYGIITYNEDRKPFYKAGETCQIAQVKPLFDSYYPSEINEGRCGQDTMYTVGRQALNLSISDIFKPQIFVVDTSYVFKDSINTNGKKLTQIELDSIYKHELGHKRDMECIVEKMKSKKVLFDGCFCKEELRSYVAQEIEKINIAYDNMLYEADSIYHHESYGNSGYPSEEERYDCVY